jgi:kynurenine formamidase
MNEHTGTHFDAPVALGFGARRAERRGGRDPAREFCRSRSRVIDCSDGAAENDDFELTPEVIEVAWEAEHGRIPAGAWVLMRTDWSKRSGPTI